MPCSRNVCLVVIDRDADSDHDGFTDADEEAYGSDPKDASSHPPVLDVLLGVFTGATPSFLDHTTELIVLPLVDPNDNDIVTGLGRFTAPALPGKSANIGLTFAPPTGVTLPGFRLDPGQQLISTGSTTKPGDRWSLVSDGKTPGAHSIAMTLEKDGSVTGELLDTGADGVGTYTTYVAVTEEDGTVRITSKTKAARVDPSGAITLSASSTQTTKIIPPADPRGTSYSTSTSTTKNENGKTVSFTRTRLATYDDGTSVTTTLHVEYHDDGTRTETETSTTRDKKGFVIDGGRTVREIDANNTEISSSEKKCPTGCDYSDPDLEQAMGWAGPLTALLDPESAVTVIAAGAPRFTSAQPDYDPLLNEIVGAVRGSGELPPGTSPYSHPE